jgi:hypothetical protein
MHRGKWDCRISTLLRIDRLQSTSSRKEDYLQLGDEIHEILCTVISLYSTSEKDGELPPGLLYDIAKFTEYPPSYFADVR